MVTKFNIIPEFNQEIMNDLLGHFVLF